MIATAGKRSRRLSRLNPVEGLRPAIFVRPILLYLAVVIILAVAFSLACGSGNDAVEPTAPTSPADASAIRQVDFRKTPDVQTLLRQLGSATVDPDSIVYVDVTGDRREEAAVPIDSGGTLGNVAFLVFTLRSGTPSLILTRTVDSVSGIVMFEEAGKLIETRGEFGPEDPFCCPSKLRRTTFRWDGSRLQVEGEAVIDNPAGRPKQ